MSLKEILSEIQEKLIKREKTRNEILGNMRQVIRLSKQAILFLHQARMSDARRFLTIVDDLLSQLDGLTEEYPDLVYTSLVEDAFQEASEAHIFYGLVQADKFINPETLRAPPISYILGLADVIGELRRRSLDSLRVGEVATAERCLEMMEQIYIELTGMDDAYILVPGLRRKCDVARRVIEATRGDVTNEVRRSSLRDSIQQLKETIRRSDEIGKTEAA